MERLRILVIDENHRNVNELCKKLQNAFPESSLLTAFNAQTGFQIAVREDSDMVFINIKMEERSNFELCRQLKARSDLADILVIFMVESRGDMERRILDMQNGGDDFILQSIDENSLFFQVLSMKKVKNDNIQKNIEFNKLNALNKKQRLLLKTYHDHLTSLYNRHYFDENLKNFDREENYPLSLVIADINGLKMINDSFGHNTGDKLIKKTTAIIQNSCRGDNLIARLGGDEFAMVLPGIDEKTADQIIKKMEVLAEKEKIKGIKLSISFGCQVKTSRDQCINELIKQAEDDMYRNKLYESGSRCSKTVELIINALYEKISREMQHSIRVGLICERIGLKMNMKEDEIGRIRAAGMIHDIGKIGIDEKILNKPSKLNDDEWKEVRRHPEIGYRILNSVKEFSEMANCALEHHERWDGTGYPKGIKGKNISLQARIVAVADAFDAMSSDRIYRKGLNTKEILEEFRKNAGTQFDPEVTKIFIENVMSSKS